MTNKIIVPLTIIMFLYLTAGTARSESSYEKNIRSAIKSLESRDIDKAKKLFTKAGKAAQKDNDWKGLIDIGYSFLSLDDRQNAEKYFSAADNVSRALVDWKPHGAMGYAFLSIGNTERANQSFETTRLQAGTANDVYGLIEAARGFLEIDNISKALGSLEDGKKIAGKTHNSDALRTIAKHFLRMDHQSGYQECIRLAQSIEDDLKELPPPPRGWQAYGESIAGLEEIPQDIQKANRASADREIADKYRWIVESQRQALKQKEMFLKYSQYYQTQTTQYYPAGIQSYFAADILRTDYLAHGLYHLFH